MKIFTTNHKVVRKIAVVLVWFVLWQILYEIIQKEILFVSPFGVGKAFIHLLLQGKTWFITMLSLGRIFFGFLLAVILGSITSFLCYKNSWFYEFLYPMVSVIRATPVVSFSILILLWMKTGLVPVAISFFMVFPVIWANVYEGLKNIEVSFLEMAQVYAFSPWKKLRYIVIPSVMPYFIASCQTGIGMAWKSGVAAEVICMPQFSIGRQLYETKIYLETPELFAWTAMMILMSVFLEKSFLFMIQSIKKKFY